MREQASRFCFHESSNTWSMTPSRSRTLSLSEGQEKGGGERLSATEQTFCL